MLRIGLIFIPEFTQELSASLHQSYSTQADAGKTFPHEMNPESDICVQVFIL